MWRASLSDSSPGCLALSITVASSHMMGWLSFQVFTHKSACEIIAFMHYAVILIALSCPHVMFCCVILAVSIAVICVWIRGCILLSYVLLLIFNSFPKKANCITSHLQ